MENLKGKTVAELREYYERKALNNLKDNAKPISDEEREYINMIEWGFVRMGETETNNLIEKAEKEGKSIDYEEVADFAEPTKLVLV